MASGIKPNLLGIPPELRNRIYDFALVSRKRLQVTDGSPALEQPALLRTCRQIRREAIAIYYTDNRFRFIVHAYDGAAMIPFREVLIKYRESAKTSNFSIALCDNCDEVHIDNLDVWLEAHYKDAKLVPGLRQDKSAEATMAMTLARRTFGVVRAMRKQGWPEVNDVLGAFYEAIEELQTDPEEDFPDTDDEYDYEDEDEAEAEADEDEGSEAADDDAADMPELI